MEFTTYTLPQRHPGHSPSDQRQRHALRPAGERRKPRRVEESIRTGSLHRTRPVQGHGAPQGLPGELPARKPRRRTQRLHHQGGYDDPRHDPAKRLFEGRRADRRRRLPFDFPPTGSLEKEKEIIYDEINTYKDSPADMIYDTFEDMLFAGSELGHNILGRKSSLARFSGESIREFVARTHTTDQMVFSSIGNLSAKSVETTVARFLNDIESSARDFSRRQPAAVEPFTRAVAKHTHQTHCIIGARAQGINDAERLPLALLVNLLGGPSANSMLNVLVREKNGLSYNIEASYTPYSDSGIVAIYFRLRPRQHGSLHRTDRGRLGRLRNTPLSARRLSMAKKQFIAQAGDLDGEQRRLHARCGQEFPGAPRGRYDGGGLSQNTGSHGRRPDRRSFVGLLLTIAAHL